MDVAEAPHLSGRRERHVAVDVHGDGARVLYNPRGAVQNELQLVRDSADRHPVAPGFAYGAQK